MAKRRREQQRLAWSGLCEECGQPLTAIKREPDGDGERVTYVCVAAQNETESWPHVNQRRWNPGHRHTEAGLATWHVQFDASGLPRPGLSVGAWRGPPLPTTEEEATAAEEDQQQRLLAVYQMLLKIGRRVRDQPDPQLPEA